MTEKEQLAILETWLGSYKGILFKVVHAYTGNHMDKDDLFQEIIIQVWRSIPVFREECSVTTWLYRIALNTAIKWSARSRKHVPSETLERVEHLIQENKCAADERLEWLYRAIHQLDEIDRSLTLLLLEGFSYKEMAVILGITESNVGVKINRIKKQLIAQSKNKYSHGI
ncbi:RNA polymerase sigma factor [Paraflavitalea soli]|uniref:RNA polymerase sigma factor n=1 Tax=Paraflavitalea soli TaxID=2315862 RepID=A0A3B7MHH0_9BACT|nr:RNA polymerase sigma factor [Paraflavitalea soli]AXY73854.1 RNA polymerase sigma factor [Paraflavitalea soli]